jgi:hypothetical protein
MQLNFLPDQNYDCVRCGYGCRHDWNVRVDQQRVENIRANYTPIKAIEAVQPAFIDNDGDITLARTPEKHCVFLEGSANCGIHATLGIDAKPRDCQHYPLSMVDTPDGIQVGITYSCTAALRNVGSPISSQADSVTHWLREFQPTKLGYQPSAVFDDVTIEWSAYKHLETELQLAINQGNCAKTLWQSLLLLRQCIMDKISTSADANLTTADLAKFNAANIAATPVQFSEELAMQLDYFGYLQLGYLGTCDRDSQQAMLDPFDETSIINLPSLHWRGSSSLMRQLMQQAQGQSEYEAEIKRYYSALLFQKKLLNDANLWTGLIKFCMLPQLIAQANVILSNSGYQHPDLTPFQYAMRLVEQDVMSHNGATSKLYAILGQMLIAG